MNDQATVIKRKRDGSKMRIVAELLARGDGCTAAEVLAGTGWRTTVSMPQMAKNLGMDLRQEKGELRADPILRSQGQHRVRSSARRS
jgi:hypothetical protein